MKKVALFLTFSLTVFLLQAQNTYTNQNQIEYSSQPQTETIDTLQHIENEPISLQDDQTLIPQPVVDSTLLITNAYVHRTKTVEHSVFAVLATASGIVFPPTLLVTVPTFVTLRVIEGQRYKKWNEGFDPRNPQPYKEWKKQQNEMNRTENDRDFNNYHNKK